jgi:hypothetical protein
MPPDILEDEIVGRNIVAVGGSGPGTFAGGMTDGQPILESQPKFDDGENHQEQQRKNDGRLDNGGASFSPLLQLCKLHKSTLHPMVA